MEKGALYHAEENIRAEDSADPVALTEADPMSVDELILQEAGRDLRPDVITPAPDIASTAVEDLEARLRAEASASDDTETNSALETSPEEEAAMDESLKDEKQ